MQKPCTHTSRYTHFALLVHVKLYPAVFLMSACDILTCWLNFSSPPPPPTDTHHLAAPTHSGRRPLFLQPELLITMSREETQHRPSQQLGHCLSQSKRALFTFASDSHGGSCLGRSLFAPVAREADGAPLSETAGPGTAALGRPPGHCDLSPHPGLLGCVSRGRAQPTPLLSALFHDSAPRCSRCCVSGRRPRDRPPDRSLSPELAEPLLACLDGHAV